MNSSNRFLALYLGLLMLVVGTGPSHAQPNIRIDPQTLVFDSVGNRTMYVELDWMEDVDHSHKPSQAVIDRIVRTFAAEGYSIVIELGNAIPHQDNLNVTGSPSGSPDVQAIRNQHFAHRLDPRWFYSIWAHQYNNGGSSGIADLPGRIHLVTLGAFTGQTGTFNHQVGTFIHEFGHNLGQRHGGADHSNYKPNYVSVMNYHFQLSGIGPVLQARGLANSSQGFNDFGYSHGALPPLDETRLDERLGIGLGRAVDWNCDGDMTDVNLARDLQEDGNWCAPVSGGLSILTDFDNWTSINNSIQAGAFFSPAWDAPPSEPSETCIDWEHHQAMLRELGPLAEPSPPPPPKFVAAGVDPGPGVMIFNDGNADLTVSLITKVTPADWIAWTPPPPFVIPPGGSRLLIVTVDFTQAPVGQSTRQLSLNSNDPDGSTNVNVVVINQASTANLRLLQKESADPASLTCPLTYTFTVTNLGPTAATNVRVTNQLPSSVTFDSASASQGTATRNGSIVVADLGTIAFSSNATFTVTVIPTTQGPLTNSAYVASGQVDPDPTDNATIETTTTFLDNAGPKLVNAAAQSDGASVMLTFSEPVAATAIHPNRYSVKDGVSNAVPVLAVLPGSSPNTVSLQMNLLTRFGPFHILATNITDCVGNQMATADGETYVTFATFTLVPAGSTWKYLDDGSDQGTGWRNLIFNDSTWASGPGQFGYGEDDEQTVIDYGGNPDAKHITTYFRKSFVLEDATTLTNAVIHLLRDDGAAVYLNGNQVVRSNLAPSAIYTTPAISAIPDSEENVFFASRINSTALRTGTNVLAVEVHQSGAGSSDVSFDLALMADLRILAVRPAFVQQPESQNALVGDTVSFNVQLTGTPPLTYRWRLNSFFVAPNQVESSTLTLTNIQLTNAGSYTVGVSNAAANVLSGRANLNVMTDVDGDRMGDQWEVLHGFRIDDPSDATGDADGDGMSNRDEFNAGTDPRQAASYLKIDSITALTNAVNIGFMAVSNRSYSVLYQEHLSSAPWLRLTNALGRTTNRVESIMDVRGTNTRRSYRLVTPKEP